MYDKHHLMEKNTAQKHIFVYVCSAIISLQNPYSSSNSLDTGLRMQAKGRKINVMGISGPVHLKGFMNNSINGKRVCRELLNTVTVMT